MIIKMEQNHLHEEESDFLDNEFIEKEHNNLARHDQRHNKHGILMLICCLVPVIAIVFLSANGLDQTELLFLAIMLCPLLHIIMMVKMRNNHETSS